MAVHRVHHFMSLSFFLMDWHFRNVFNPLHRSRMVMHRSKMAVHRVHHSDHFMSLWFFLMDYRFKNVFNSFHRSRMAVHWVHIMILSHGWTFHERMLSAMVVQCWENSSWSSIVEAPRNHTKFVVFERIYIQKIKICPRQSVFRPCRSATLIG